MLKSFLISLIPAAILSMNFSAKSLFYFGRNWDGYIPALFLSFAIFEIILSIPIYIAHVKQSKKIGWVSLLVWLSWLPFGPIFYFSSLIWALCLSKTPNKQENSYASKNIKKESKEKQTQQQNKETHQQSVAQNAKTSNEVESFYGIGLTVLVLLFVGLAFILHSIYKDYQSSFILPKRSEYSYLSQVEQRCYTVATLGNRSKREADDFYRSCLDEAEKEAEKREEERIQAETTKIKSMTKQQKRNQVAENCTKLFTQTPQTKHISKYDKTAINKEIKRVEKNNLIIKDLCKCTSELFIKEATEAEVIDYFLQQPMKKQNMFYSSSLMPFRICIEQGFPNIVDRMNAEKVLGISFLGL